MKVLHPERTKLNRLVYRGMFPEVITQLTTRLQSEQFQQLLKTDATTFDGQDFVAEYFKVSEQWKNEIETNTPPSYFSCSNSSNNIAKKTMYGYPSGRECTDM